MKIITSISEMQKWRRQLHLTGKIVGFIPTMGCLHEGHISLIKNSVDKCDFTVVSIFVNPIQFGPNEDFESYPRIIDSDKIILKKTGIDVLFSPKKNDIYPENFQTFVEVEDKTQYLCGKSRSGFFRGVTTIVLKLFNIIRPHIAFFGEKDWQQLEVIRTMVNDLNMEILIKSNPIVREKDGLAMSSRNRHLSVEDRSSARSLSQALESAQASILKGEQSAENIRTEIRKKIELHKGIKIDYISVCDQENFKEQSKIGPKTLIALAVRIGSVRLIDNRFIERV